MNRLLHLDTNALIALSDPWHPLFRRIEQRLQDGWTAATDAVAWHEYVRGPLLEEDRKRALLVVEQRVGVVTRAVAEKAAEFFNATGRRRGSTADCLIAAACLRGDAELVTANRDDFALFVPYGLRLCEP
jgi:predicted nucleic acid-binding protein